MTGIIVAGHETSPEGILSAVSLVARKPDNMEAVNFEMRQSLEDLKDSMVKTMESLGGDEILTLADLVGSISFNTVAALRKARIGKWIKVIAGVNMAAMVGIAFSRPMYRLDELVVVLLAAGREGLRDLDALDNEEEAPELEDGLQEWTIRPNYKVGLQDQITKSDHRGGLQSWLTFQSDPM